LTTLEDKIKKLKGELKRAKAQKKRLEYAMGST
jgi:hypothetical protein